MKKIFLLSVFCVLVVFAQTQSPLKLSVDIARFTGDSNHVYFEVYYSFDVSDLSYQKNGEEYQSEAVMDVWFKRSSDDSIVARQVWRIPFTVNDTSLLATSRNYIDVYGFLLEPDVYRAFFVVSDFHKPEMRDSQTVVLNITDITKSQLALSDVELCNSITQVDYDAANRFYKNTYEVKPNPSKVFGLHQPVVFYYVEAYNITPSETDKYYTKAAIKNSLGNEVISHEKAKRKINKSSVEVGVMNISKLHSGSYQFSYTITDSATRQSYTSFKRLFIYNPQLPPDTLITPNTTGVEASEFATMTEEELDKIFEQSRYVARGDELARYKKLKTLDAKRKAVYEFWSSRDEDKSTPQNETKQEYFHRITYANQQYKTGPREGWRTDRGRVYVTYGPPDDIERHANELDVKPYEIWYYNSIQGGVQFIFGDRTGFSDYILLHSTHRNELHDENWKQQIQAN